MSFLLLPFRFWLPLWESVLWNPPLLRQAQLSIRLQSWSCCQDPQREPRGGCWQDPENMKRTLNTLTLNALIDRLYRTWTPAQPNPIFLWGPFFCYTNFPSAWKLAHILIFHSCWWVLNTLGNWYWTNVCIERVGGLLVRNCVILKSGWWLPPSASCFSWESSGRPLDTLACLDSETVTAVGLRRQPCLLSAGTSSKVNICIFFLLFIWPPLISVRSELNPPNRSLFCVLFHHPEMLLCAAGLVYSGPPCTRS